MIALSGNSGTAFASKVSDQKNAQAEGLQRTTCCDLRVNEYTASRK
jgi:hypothetical protein